ncbi:lysophospholipid acyltransferase family protein [Chloroflexota bacterium]
MPTGQSNPPKPVSETWRPELTRLPDHNPFQRFFRWFIRGFTRMLVFFFTRAEVSGMENYPSSGPALVVINHLGDADGALGVAFWPVFTDAFAKIELYDLPILGKVIHWIGVIWVHRGQPDRKAISSALEGFRKGRIISIAPEGRESLTGALEGGTEGAAYLAWKAKVPIVPIAITGTYNDNLYHNMKRLKKTDVTMTVGKPFFLPEGMDRKQALEDGTRLIMESLACLLPRELRGNYTYVSTRDEN